MRDPGNAPRFSYVVDGALSPDRSYCVFQVSETVETESGAGMGQVDSLWRIELAGGSPTRLTAATAGAREAHFSPDGKWLFYLSRMQGDADQVCRLDLATGAQAVLSSADGGIAALDVSADGESIAFTATTLLRAPEAAGCVRISRHLYRIDGGPGYLEQAARGLYVMPSEGGVPGPVVVDGLVQAFAWAPSSQRVAVFTVGKRSHRTSPMLGDLSIVDLEGRERILLAEISVIGLFWTPDEAFLGYVGYPCGDLSKQPRLFLVDCETCAVLGRTESLNLPVGRLIETHNPSAPAAVRVRCAPDGESAVVPITCGGAVQLCHISLHGVESCTPVTAGRSTCELFDRQGDIALYASQDINVPPELFMLDLRTGESRQLTSQNTEWSSGPVPEWYDIIAETRAGVRLEGWVIVPRESVAPFPTILFIHGGPHFGFGYSFNEDFHEMVAAGYAVAFANPRGSTGYGDAFSSAIVGRWGYPELEDLNVFLDELVRRGIADPDRLGVTGQSGGGHLSAWLVGHTHRFKAAAPEQGVYNMLSMYGVSDAGVHLITLEMEGPPHIQFERYWDLSPIAHAHHCNTPTLIIHGEDDLRCPMEQAEQLYTVLKHNRCDVELLRIKDCNHGAELYGPPHLRRMRLEALKRWFDRYLRGP